MIDTSPTASEPTPHVHPQADLPGIPRGSSLHDILSSYGLVPTEAPGGLRRFRHELACNDLYGIAEVSLTAEGHVEWFRIRLQRPRQQRANKTTTAS